MMFAATEYVALDLYARINAFFPWLKNQQNTEFA